MNKFNFFHWDVALSPVLKQRGYSFHKLFANNYKVYERKIGNYSVWCWVKGKTIEVNDWHHTTKNIINFYILNRELPEFDEPGFQKEKKGYIKVQVNRETGYVQLFDKEEYYKVFSKKDIAHAWDEWNEKYGRDWSNEIYLYKEDMELLLTEITFLENATNPS